MTNFQISVLCLIVTVAIYFANKRLYRRFRTLPLMPLVFTPILLVLMLTLILCRVIPLNWVRAGARWLLAEMLLFFVPAVVAVVNYAQLLMVDGWRIFAVIALSTLMVLGATAWVVDKVYRFEISRHKHD